VARSDGASVAKDGLMKSKLIGSEVENPRYGTQAALGLTLSFVVATYVWVKAPDAGLSGMRVPAILIAVALGGVYAWFKQKRPLVPRRTPAALGIVAYALAFIVWRAASPEVRVWLAASAVTPCAGLLFVCANQLRQARGRPRQTSPMANWPLP
jgi:peptidoglycan/LPS O-acetylase OafA/YrhL